MRTLVRPMLLVLVLTGRPAFGEEPTATAPVQVDAPAAAPALVGDATLGEAVPTARLDAEAVIASANQSTIEDEDDTEFFIVLFFVSLGAFSTVYQSLTAEHP